MHKSIYYSPVSSDGHTSGLLEIVQTRAHISGIYQGHSSPTTV